MLAVGSDRFVDKEWSSTQPPVLFAKTHGKGCVILVNSLDYPGASGLRPFYRFLLHSAMAANQGYPTVEASDRIRYASYRTDAGRVLYFLNTEENLPQSVILHESPDRQQLFTLAPGEIRQCQVNVAP